MFTFEVESRLRDGWRMKMEGAEHQTYKHVFIFPEKMNWFLYTSGGVWGGRKADYGRGWAQLSSENPFKHEGELLNPRQSD